MAPVPRPNEPTRTQPRTQYRPPPQHTGPAPRPPNLVPEQTSSTNGWMYGIAGLLVIFLFVAAVNSGKSEPVAISTPPVYVAPVASPSSTSPDQNLSSFYPTAFVSGSVSTTLHPRLRFDHVSMPRTATAGEFVTLEFAVRNIGSKAKAGSITLTFDELQFDPHQIDASSSNGFTRVDLIEPGTKISVRGQTNRAPSPAYILEAYAAPSQAWLSNELKVFRLTFRASTVGEIRATLRATGVTRVGSEAEYFSTPPHSDRQDIQNFDAIPIQISITP
jgi:hypothetical protein